MSASPLSPADQTHAEANQWTQHGIRLLEQGDRDSLLEAQLCFEQAITLREELPLESNVWFRWGLTAGWMNRADALTRLGGAERLTDALQSYDIAIAHLHRLPLDTDPLFRWRLGLAWMNRGHVERTIGGHRAGEKALSCIDTALQVMGGSENSPRLEYQQLQASAWMNRACVLLELSPADPALAAASARRSIRHSRPLEQTDPLAAEVGIKARHTLCKALAVLLESGPAKTDDADSWIHEATDTVEEVMHLTKDTALHQPLREDLFSFGCRIYRAFQPHFLAEFLNDGLAAGSMSEEMHKSARESLAQAAFHIQQQNLAGLTSSRLDKLIHTLQKLSETGEKLTPQIFAKP